MYYNQTMYLKIIDIKQKGPLLCVIFRETQYKYKYYFYVLSTLIGPEDIAASNIKLSLKELRV